MYWDFDVSDRFVNTGLNLVCTNASTQTRGGGWMGTKIFCGQFVQKKSYVNEKRPGEGDLYILVLKRVDYGMFFFYGILEDA